jgi:hypothetical protein
MDVYRHTQAANALMWGITLGGLAAAVAVYRATGNALGATLLAVVMFLTTLLFASLTVVVGRGELILRFGVGPIQKRFRVDQITGARIVRNRWWYGWGIHLTPHGWLYNVAGLDAVEIELEGKRRVRIGTDEPRRLLAAIQQVAPATRG